MCVGSACGRFGVVLLADPETTVSPSDGKLQDAGGIRDAGSDGGLDAGFDSGLDAGSDSGLDAGTDASTQPVDAGCMTPCANAHGGADCSTGQCQITCQTGYADCDGRTDNGCEVATATDLMSCGGCDLACSTPQGTTSCAQGVCTPSCTPGVSGDCDGDVRNGCETQLTTDLRSCGRCGATCSNPNGSTSCVAGVCTPTCATGYADCNGDPNDGCETRTASDPANCGGCGVACDTTFQVCASGSCQVSTCPAGSGDCDTNQSNCETDLTRTVSDCGFCNNACTVAHGTPSCSNSTCAVASCDPGYADCDANAATGCEVALATTVSSCGRCGNACSNAHGSTTCTSGACAPTCSSGWGSCDSNANNGCETALNTLTNCGRCGNVCPNAMSGATAVCNSGICGYACNTLSGVYALRINAQTSWPATQYVQSGSGTAQFWLRVTLTQSGTSLSGSAQLCDQATPEFRNTVTSDRYLVDYPAAMFTPGAPGAAFSGTLASLAPGAALSSARTAHLLGINLSDPLNGAWPALSAARSSQVDHDGDGDVGITVVFVDDGTYNHVQTDGSFFAARASHGYGAQRLRFALGGALSGCTGASGSATVSFDTQTIGCRLESGQDCSSSQYSHLYDNKVVHSIGSASYSMTRLGDTGSSFTCAQVRSAL